MLVMQDALIEKYRDINKIMHNNYEARILAMAIAANWGNFHTGNLLWPLSYCSALFHCPGPLSPITCL